MDQDLAATRRLAASITRAASLQTYCTIRLLADHDRASDAFRAYAYFRWVDDCLDEGGLQRSERLAFVQRQATLVKACYRGLNRPDASPEERMLVDLIRANAYPRGPLACYIDNMLAVMAFDADRRGRLISQAQLNAYQHALAVAVTEALHYFVGRGCAAPRTGARYRAVTAAHITHMLRDTSEDVQAGYFNIPLEFLHAHNTSPLDFNGSAYSAWVQERVQLARRYFKEGREYLAQVGNARCRLAGLAYAARFETVLDVMERDGYHLRPEYRSRRTLGGAFRLGWSMLHSALQAGIPTTAFRALTVR